MISVRTAIVLSGMIALVMVGLAASSLLAPAGTGGPDDVAIDDTAVETVAADEPIETPAEEETSRVTVVILGEVVTRGEMAAVLSSALGLTARADNPFADDDGSPFEADIERLVAAGITKGCNPPENTRFCPDNPLTRQEAATMLARGFGLTARADDPFVDDDGTFFEADIERLAAAGITRGCNPPENTKFCPTGLISGDEMAVFLDRAEGLSP